MNSSAPFNFEDMSPEQIAEHTRQCLAALLSRDATAALIPNMLGQLNPVMRTNTAHTSGASNQDRPDALKISMEQVTQRLVFAVPGSSRSTDSGLVEIPAELAADAVQNVTAPTQTSTPRMIEDTRRVERKPIQSPKIRVAVPPGDESDVDAYSKDLGAFAMAEVTFGEDTVYEDEDMPEADLIEQVIDTDADITTTLSRGTKRAVVEDEDNQMAKIQSFLQEFARMPTPTPEAIRSAALSPGSAQIHVTTEAQTAPVEKKKRKRARSSPARSHSTRHSSQATDTTQAHSFEEEDLDILDLSRSHFMLRPNKKATGIRLYSPAGRIRDHTRIVPTPPIDFRPASSTQKESRVRTSCETQAQMEMDTFIQIMEWDAAKKDHTGEYTSLLVLHRECFESRERNFHVIKAHMADHVTRSLMKKARFNSAERTYFPWPADFTPTWMQERYQVRAQRPDFEHKRLTPGVEVMSKFIASADRMTRHPLEHDVFALFSADIHHQYGAYCASQWILLGNNPMPNANAPLSIRKYTDFLKKFVDYERKPAKTNAAYPTALARQTIYLLWCLACGRTRLRLVNALLRQTGYDDAAAKETQMLIECRGYADLHTLIHEYLDVDASIQVLWREELQLMTNFLLFAVADKDYLYEFDANTVRCWAYRVLPLLNPVVAPHFV